MLLFVIPALLAAAFLAALYYGYRLAFFYQDPHKAPEDYVVDDQIGKVKPSIDSAIAVFQAAPYETVAIKSHDGLLLKGRYYHVADNAPLYIQMHGYKGDASRDFGGTWQIARELGHNVLLADQRCHGDSEGHTITFGIKEQRDCLAWARYALDRFGPVPVLLMGVSMGAATVLMASGLELPANVKGVVADCPYDAPANIIQKVLRVEMGMPVKLVYPLIRLGGILYGRFDLESCSPLQAIRKTRLPILLIHGDEDRFVPWEMSCNLHQAAPEKITFHTIAGSGHALNQVTDPELYRRILIPFIQSTLGRVAP